MMGRWFGEKTNKEVKSFVYDVGPNLAMLIFPDHNEKAFFILDELKKFMEKDNIAGIDFDLTPSEGGECLHISITKKYREALTSRNSALNTAKKRAVTTAKNLNKLTGGEATDV
jgi:hypothetical protein